MENKILCVDDEPNILSGYKRQLHGQYHIETAVSGAEGLEIIDTEGPFAVVVSDMQMPVMDGIEFLGKVRDKYPETVRIMLTGNADMQTAIDAVNEGNIFRFLTKPCSSRSLAKSLDAGIRQYQLVRAEQELLRNTLQGAVKMLVEILSMTNPAALSHASRIRKYTDFIVEKMKYDERWQFEIAATLSQIGCVTLPQEVLAKVYSKIRLTEDEAEMFASHPAIGYKLISKIPRLEVIAGMIRDQQLPCLDGIEPKRAGETEKMIARGAQVLKAAADFDRLIYCGSSITMAIEEMKSKKQDYNPDILKCLEIYKIQKSQTRRMMLKIKELGTGMITDQEIHAKNGLLLVGRGRRITLPVIARLNNFNFQTGVNEPIAVIVPSQK